MRPEVEMARSLWWGFAGAGVAALAAALVTFVGGASPALATAAWLVLAGALVLVAAFRAPGGRGAVGPFLGAAVVGLVFGAAVLAFGAVDTRVAVIAAGLWSLVSGASYRVVALLVRALGAEDGGLLTAAWLALVSGIVTSTVAFFGLVTAPAACAAALAVAGAVAVNAGARLRRLSAEAGAPVRQAGRRRGRASRR